MASDFPESRDGSSARVGQGVLSAGHGNVTIGSIAYHNQREQDQRRRPTLMESLDFPERARRERTITNTHRDTGRWFLRTQEYLDWQPSSPPGFEHGDRPDNDRLSNNRRTDDNEDDQEPARCCGIFPKADKAPRRVLRSDSTVRRVPKLGSSAQTSFPAPALPLMPQAPRSALVSERTSTRNPVYRSSVQADWKQRLLWIKGNAGAGKSTLLKMVVDHDRTTHSEALILPHFFNARGTELEHSTDGMYRTLICWLLETQPNDFAIKLDPNGTRAAIREWHIPELERLLSEAMGIVEHTSVAFYIDALDECDEAQIRQMLEYFRNLVKTAWDVGREVRVCFASRPYPHITFDDAAFLDLSRQKEHIQDIKMYINDRLEIQESRAAVDIRAKLLKKAEGVFMWAVLVIEMLNKACDEGRVERLPQMLEEIPLGLYELFDYTLERYPKNLDATLVCFRWLLFSSNHMDPSQMWWAMQLGLGLGDEEIRRDYERMSESAMQRYIVGTTKGLVEFRTTSEANISHAQFVHESVRDFLLNDSALWKLYGVRSRIDFAGQSHELLRDWFAAELASRRPQLIEVVNERGGRMLTGKDFVKIGWRKGKREPRADFKGNSYERRLPGRHSSGPRHSQLKTTVNERRQHEIMADDKEESKIRFPLALLASFAVWQQLEAAQQCGKDQKTYLDSVLERFGPYLFGDRLPDGEGRIYCDVISPLLLMNCAAVIRHTQLESAQLARRSGQAFGLIDSSSRKSPLARARRSGNESVLALVDMYLQLEPQHPGLRQLLRRLARNLRTVRYVHRRALKSGHGPLLDLAVEDTSLAIFFLLVLASPELLSHLKNLNQLVDHVIEPGLRLVHFLLYFVEHDLHTDALDFSCEGVLGWALKTEIYYKTYLPSLIKEEMQASEEVSEASSRLVALLRARFHQSPGPSA